MSHTTEHLALDTGSPQLIPGVIHIDVSGGIGQAVVYVKLVDIDSEGTVVSGGASREFRFDGSSTPTGVDVMFALNTADHSVTTLHAHVIQILIDAGLVSGSITAGDAVGDASTYTVPSHLTDEDHE